MTLTNGLLLAILVYNVFLGSAVLYWLSRISGRVGRIPRQARTTDGPSVLRHKDEP